jgi:hypothetical protein
MFLEYNRFEIVVINKKYTWKIPKYVEIKQHISK